MSAPATTSSDPKLPPEGPGAGLTCPLCDYDLRGLAEPRCPECGYAFDWEELRAISEHPYLFEHHPRRNVRSFLATLRAGWGPATFWTTLQPTQPANDRRLATYQFLVSLAAWLVPLAIAVSVVAQSVQNSMSLMNGLERAFINHRSTRHLTIVAVQLVLWPWLTYATLMIFQATMRRARIRQAHLLRCAIYASDAVAIGALVLLAVVGVAVFADGIDWLSTSRPLVRDAACLVMFATPLIVAWRLAHACRRYLRIPHAAGVAIVTQFMLALVLLIVGFRVGMLNLYWLYL